MADKKTAKKTSAPKPAKPYKTLSALVKAKKDGKLPMGFKLTIDNDGVYGYAGEVQLYDGENGDDDPSKVLAAALKLLGLNAAKP